MEICYCARNRADLKAPLPAHWALEVQQQLARHRGNSYRRPLPNLIITATAELGGAEKL
jgi:hypothetical protein